MRSLKVGQKWVIKPESKRDWRKAELNITGIVFEKGGNTFTCAEWGSKEICYELLESHYDCHC